MLKSTRRALRQRSRRGHGQALVEFALVIPLFLVVLFGILYFGFMLFTKMSVINAAREGARVAAMTADVTTISTAASSRVISAGAAAGLGLTASNVTSTCVQTSLATPGTCTFTLHTTSNPNGAQQGDSIKVVVNYGFPNPIPLHLKLLGNVIVDLPSTISLSSTVQMVLDSVTSQ